MLKTVKIPLSQVNFLLVPYATIQVFPIKFFSLLRVINDMWTRATSTITKDVFFDWEYDLESSEEYGFHVGRLRQNDRRH